MGSTCRRAAFGGAELGQDRLKSLMGVTRHSDSTNYAHPMYFALLPFSPPSYLSEMIRIPRRLIYAVRAEVVPRILILILISPLLTREVRSKCRLSRRTDVEHKFSIFGKFQSSFSPSGGKEEKRD